MLKSVLPECDEAVQDMTLEGCASDLKQKQTIMCWMKRKYERGRVVKPGNGKAIKDF